MLAWLDEAGGAYAGQCCDTPRMVTVRMGETFFKKPIRPGHVIKIYGKVVRVDGDGEAIPLGEKVRNKYKTQLEAVKKC